MTWSITPRLDLVVSIILRPTASRNDVASPRIPTLAHGCDIWHSASIAMEYSRDRRDRLELLTELVMDRAKNAKLALTQVCSVAVFFHIGFTLKSAGEL